MVRKWICFEQTPVWHICRFRHSDGGARCGALEIVHIPTGKTRTITTKLVSIYGGFWM